MAWATDRDLLAFEPAVFGRVAWLGQRLVSGTGSLAAAELVMSAQDVAFDAAGVGAGHVAIVDGAAHEVVARVDGQRLTLSRLRGSVDDDPITPADETDAAVVVSTFAPQIADVHRRVVAMLGLTGSSIGEEGGGPTESSVTNGGELVRLEALGALHLVFAGAAATTRGESVEWQKSEWYRGRFDEERRRAVARLDTDGDGVADAVRRPSVLRLVRV